MTNRTKVPHGYRVSDSDRTIYVEERVSPLLYHANVMWELRDLYPGYKTVYDSK